MTGSADLDQRFRFEQRALDDNGDRLGPWDTAGGFSRLAKVTWLNGGEGVLQQRLAGTQPAILTLRDEARVRAVDNSYRSVDVRTGVAYEVTSQHPAKDRDFREILVVEVRGDDD